MVRWYHLIISAYGFWLPNDPRGSWSDFVWAWELLKFGDASKVEGKRSYAHDPHDEMLRREAKAALKYPPVRFDEAQREVIAAGFARAVSEGAYGIFACCVGHDHAHLIVERHPRAIERITTHLKSKSSMSLRAAGCHPLKAYARNSAIPSPWSQGSWSVFISEETHLRSAIEYVKRHPIKESLAPQNWPFIRAFPSDPV
jgi:REP element-mobilizing transposase RayT